MLGKEEYLEMCPKTNIFGEEKVGFTSDVT